MDFEDRLAEILFDDGALTAHFEARPTEEWFFALTSLGIAPNPAQPDRPYIVWKELPDQVHEEVKETSNSRFRNFQFSVYDEKGSFTRINAILNDLRRVVKNMAPFTTEEGIHCSASDHMGFSGQIVDDGYDSCVRYAIARFNVSQ